jgi:tRNA threonylcarbamoyladenosine biosynthesis protein TsaB
VNVLALETSTDRLSLAVARGPARHARDRVVGHRHAETLFAELESLFAEAGLDVAALDAVAFGAGPGAFTGLRIACGVAQGIAAARALPVIGVSCLEAIALASGAPRALVCIDARMGEVYHAAYVRGDAGVMVEALAPWVGPPGEAPLAARFGSLVTRVNADLVPTAAAILDLALPRLAAGAGTEAALAVPIYLRERVALTVAERMERRP